MGQVETFFICTIASAAFGFAAGFFYGIDQGHKHFGSQLRAAQAEARECRKAAMNMASLIGEKGSTSGRKT